MVPREAANGIPSADMKSIHRLVERFENAWESGSRPAIKEFLPAGPDSVRRRLLELLVAVDLDYRWRDGSRSAAVPPGEQPLADCPLLEDYLARYPGLGPPDQLSPDLIREEY